MDRSTLDLLVIAEDLDLDRVLQRILHMARAAVGARTVGEQPRSKHGPARTAAGRTMLRLTTSRWGRVHSSQA